MNVNNDNVEIAAQKPVKKSGDLMVMIVLLALWGVFRLFTVSLTLLSDSYTMPFMNMIFGGLLGVSLLISAYGLWVIRPWAFKLGMFSVIAVLLENIYLGVYIGVLIVALAGYYIYKNKDLYD